MFKGLVLVLAATAPLFSAAAPGRPAGFEAKLIEMTLDKELRTVGVTNLEPAHRDCMNGIEQIVIGGLQYQRGGNSIESFWYADKKLDAQFSVTVNLDAFETLRDARVASAFFQVGKSYFAHIQTCGNGGYNSLISAYRTDLIPDASKAK